MLVSHHRCKKYKIFSTPHHRCKNTKSWQRGKEAVDALRAQLSTIQQDALCPLVEGGVNLHKLYGVMHDTCNTANLVAQLIIELQQRQKREYLTEEARSQACAP